MARRTDGQIIERPNGRYLVRWHEGQDRRTGKYVYKSKTIRGRRRDAQTYLNANNAMDDLSAIAMHPNIWRIFAGLKTGIASDQTSLELPPSIADISQFISTGADDVASPEDYHVTLGNFSDLLVGFRMDPTVLILNDTTSMAANLLIEIVGITRVDIVALRPASFVVLEDLTTV